MLRITSPSELPLDVAAADTKALAGLEILLINRDLYEKLRGLYAKDRAYCALVTAWLQGLNIDLKEPQKALHRSYLGRYPSYDDALWAAFDAEGLINVTMDPDAEQGVKADPRLSSKRPVVWEYLQERYLLLADGNTFHVFRKPVGEHQSS